MLKVDDRRTPLSRTEAGSGQAILFVHAFPLDGRMWLDQMAALPDGWNGIAPDLPGFGATGEAVSQPTMDSYADDLVGVLDDLGIARAVICGLSMGGYVALAMSRRHADRVRALVLCDTRSEADNAAARVGRLEMAQKVRQSGMQVLIDAMLPKLVSRITRLGKPAVMTSIEEMIRTTRPEGAAAALTAMGRRPDSSSVLRDVTVPTLIVVGADDEITPPGESQMMARGIRGARIEVIENAGHLSNMEQPASFNASLRAFLATLPVPAT